GNRLSPQPAAGYREGSYSQRNVASKKAFESVFIGEELTMATKHHQFTDELQETASLYTAGALSEPERLEFARHLEEDDCGVCRSEVRELHSATSLLAYNLPLQTPSARVRERLMEQARGAAPARQNPRWSIWAAAISGLAAVAASAILVVV